jgi:hypothetical protein
VDAGLLQLHKSRGEQQLGLLDRQLVERGKGKMGQQNLWTPLTPHEATLPVPTTCMPLVALLLVDTRHFPLMSTLMGVC